MQSSFDRSLSAVLRHEGGYVNNPKDNGGPTNKGVTLVNFRRFVKPDGTIADLKALTTDQAGTVFRRQYWDAVSGGVLPVGIDYATFDMAIHSGPRLAAKFLQRAVGAKDDGAIGPKTLEAIVGKDPAAIINAMLDARMTFLRKHEDWPTFGKGWISRVAGVRKLALQMAAEGGEAPADGDVIAGGGSAPQSTPQPQPPAPTRDVIGWELDWKRVGIFLGVAGLAAYAIFKTFI